MDDIMRIDLADIELTGGNMHRSWLNRSIGSGDAKANAFGVRVFRDGEAVDLTGGSVQGYFRNSQGENIALTSGNTVDGNVAYVVLPQACYNYEGQFTLAIKVINSAAGETGTMRIVDGMVDNTNSGGAVAPTGTVPTYQEILAVYGEMVETVADYEEVVANQDQQIDDLKSALQEELKSEYRVPQTINIEYTYGNGIAIGTGANYTDDTVCRSGYNRIYYPVCVLLDNTDYEYVVWCYTSTSVSSATYSPTNKKYAQGRTVINLNDSGNTYFRIGFRRVDKAALTTDPTDPTSDAAKIIAALKFYKETDAELKTEGAPADAKATGKVKLSSMYFENTEEATLVSGYYPVNAVGGDPVSEEPSATTGTTRCAQMSCVPGDVFQVGLNGAGTSSGGARAYGFLDSNRVVLERAAQNVMLVDEFLTAPANAAFIVVNSTSISGTPLKKRYIIKGNSLSLAINEKTNEYESVLFETVEEAEFQYNTIYSVPDVGSSVSAEPDRSASAAHGSYQFECVPGDVFQVGLVGGGTSEGGGRAYGFLDANRKVLERAKQNTTLIDKILIAPENAAYLVLNSQEPEDVPGLPYRYAVKGNKLSGKIVNLKGETEGSRVHDGGFLRMANAPEPIPGTSNSAEQGDPTYRVATEYPYCGDGELPYGYEAFIANTWDTLLPSDHETNPDFNQATTKINAVHVTRETNWNSTAVESDDEVFPIYRYVFTPQTGYEKTILLTGGCHGNEAEAYWSLYRLIRMIYFEGYKYPSLHNLRNVRIIVIPIWNPWGMHHYRRYNAYRSDDLQAWKWLYTFSHAVTVDGESVPITDMGEANSIYETLADFKGELNLWIDFHTDPYSGRKTYSGQIDGPRVGSAHDYYGVYGIAKGNSVVFNRMVNVMQDFFNIMTGEFGFTSVVDSDVTYPAPVWNPETRTPTFGSAFANWQATLGFPCALVEVCTFMKDFPSADSHDNWLSGSANIMKFAQEYYGNCIADLLRSH